MSESKWKELALKRRLDIKKEKKRGKEIIHSREEWKKKALERQQTIVKLQKQVQDIKKNIQRILET